MYVSYIFILKLYSDKLLSVSFMVINAIHKYGGHLVQAIPKMSTILSKSQCVEIW